MKARQSAVVVGCAAILAVGCAGEATPRGGTTPVAERAVHRRLEAAAWARALDQGEYTVVAPSPPVADREYPCWESPPEAAAGSVRLLDHSPNGSSQRLYRERGSGALWVVDVAEPMHAPPDPSGRAVPLPATQCYSRSEPVPAGAHLAGEIWVR